MSFAQSPFGFDPFGKNPSSGATGTRVPGTGDAGGASTAEAEGASYTLTVTAGAGTVAAVAVAAASGRALNGAYADGSSTASATGSTANDPHWGNVVFLADFNPLVASTDIIDYKGHVVIRGSRPILRRSAGAEGNGYIQGGTGVAGYVAYVGGFSTDFNGFRKTDVWTIETRLLVDNGWQGVVLSIQDNAGSTALNVRVENDFVSSFAVLVQPQNTNVSYTTGMVFANSSAHWHSFIIESDGTHLWLAHDGVLYPLTPDTTTSINAAANAGFIINGTSTTGLGCIISQDELRVTKASRYGGAGFPAKPWPYFTGREASSSRGEASGTSTASASSSVVSADWLGQGSSAGAATVSGAGSKLTSGTGISAGSSAARSLAPTEATGFADAGSTSVGQGRAIISNSPSAAGASSATGESSSYGAGNGRSAASATATADAQSIVVVSGACSGKASAHGRGGATVYAAGNIAGRSMAYAFSPMQFAAFEISVMMRGNTVTAMRAERSLYV